MRQPHVRWGILSTANIGRKAVAPAIKASRNGELLAVASRQSNAAKDYARELEIDRAYGSYEDLLADPDIDAVYIPLPNSMHKEWSIKAAEAKKHILCEKPLALTAVECLDMGRAAQENDVKLMEAFMYRFHPRTEEVLRRIRQGVVGEVRLIRSAFTFAVSSPSNIRLQPELGGGSLMDVGCYCVNVSRTLVSAEPIEVQAYAHKSLSGVDTELVANLHFPSGVFAQFHCALTLPRQEFYDVVGSTSRIHVPSAFLPGSGSTTYYLHHASSKSEERSSPGTDQYRLMVEHFADCILQDQPVRYPVSEAAANMRVIEALHRSIQHAGQSIAV